MEPHYRPADMIELHDSGYIIVRESYPHARTGWRATASQGGYNYTLQGSQIQRLAKYFDILTRKAVPRTRDKNAPLVAFDEDTFTVQREYTTVGQSADPQLHLQHIKELSAWIEAPHLLHITCLYTHRYTDNMLEITEEITKQISYSGRFTVWWSEG